NSSTITGLCEGEYTVEITDALGLCPVDSTVTLYVSSIPDASFSLFGFCEGKPNNAIITGDLGGVFSFNPPVNDGATIDNVTGEIINGVGGNVYSVEYE